MAQLHPEHAARITRGTWSVDEPTRPLGSFAIDTRLLESGQVFAALKTERRDGHAYLQQALDRGAMAALVEVEAPEVNLPQLRVPDVRTALHQLAAYCRQDFDRTVIGITGSFGKTTVKEMLGKVMGSQWFRTPGNFNNLLGVPLSLLQIDRFHDAGAILEAGINQPGEMEQLAALIDPQLAIITAVGPAHLEALGDLNGVAHEKAFLAKAVRPGGQVILPASLLAYRPFRELSAGVRVHALSINGSGAYEGPLPQEMTVTFTNYKWTTDQRVRGHGRLQAEDGSPDTYTFEAGSPGMVSNLSLVVHTARLLNVPEGTIQSCLDAWRPVRQRGEIFRKGRAHFYVDCYNANPGSVIDSARRFQNLFGNDPQTYILGSMAELGEASTYWHEETASRLQPPPGSLIILIGDGAEAMRKGLLKSGHAESSIRTLPSAFEVGPLIEDIEGAIFLKGSRRHQLETLIPEGANAC